MTDWARRNWGLVVGLFTSPILCTLLIYATGAYIDRRISEQLRSFVPTQVWQTWASERGEWRGAMEARVTALERQQSEVLRRLDVIAVKIDTLTTMLDEHKKMTVSKPVGGGFAY